MNHKLNFNWKKTKKWAKIVQLIKQHHTIYIFGHSGPDGDCLGSQVALKNAIKLKFPAKQVYAPVRQTENKWLFQTYAQDPTPDVKTLNNSLIILVDVADTSRTDYPILQQAKNLLIIDHHIINHAKLHSSQQPHWIDDQYSSACEMIAVFLLAHGWKINRVIANALLTGIITDTGGLKFSSTSAQTFHVCGALIKKGAQLTKLHEKISSLSKQDLKTFHFFQKNYVDAGKLKYLIFKPTDQTQLPWVTETHQLKRYLYFLKNIAETEIWGTFIQFGATELINCSLRSKRIDINQIASQFGGGGHKLASGIKLQNWSEVDKLIRSLKQEFN